MKKIHPLILVYIFIILITFAYSSYLGMFDAMMLMDYFMGFIFLTFGVLKVFDIKNFATMYKKYDVLAKNFPEYSYFYPFIEIALGLWFVLSGSNLVVDVIALIILLVNFISLYKVFVKKDEMLCVCLGSKCLFPFGKILLSENILMLVMVINMLVKIIFATDVSMDMQM